MPTFKLLVVKNVTPLRVYALPMPFPKLLFLWSHWRWKKPALGQGNSSKQYRSERRKGKNKPKEKIIIFPLHCQVKLREKLLIINAGLVYHCIFFFPLRRLKSGSKCILFRLQYSACTTHSQFANIQQETWHLTMPNFD